jgi:hypothetical protein
MEMKEKGAEAFVEMNATILRAHGYDFHCEEDDEKFVFVLKYCPSGGRMMKEGKSDTSSRHPLNFGTTKKPYPWSFNRAGVLYYCCHCPLWLDILPGEWGWDVFEAKFGRQFDEKGISIDEPCKMIIYKEPRSRQ